MSNYTYSPYNELISAARDILERPMSICKFERIAKALEAIDAETKFRDTHWDLVQRARDEYASDEIEIDDDPIITDADEGVWVNAWVYVAKPTDEDEE